MATNENDNDKNVSQPVNFDPSSATELDKSFMDHVKDTGLNIAQGGLGVVNAAIGLSDMQNQGLTSKFVRDKLKFDPRAAQSKIYSAKSDAAKADDREFQSEDTLAGKFGVALSNPSMVTGAVIESLPSMFVGGALGKSLNRATGGQLGGVAAGAIGEGVMMAGQQASSIRDDEANVNRTLDGTQTAMALGTGVMGGLLGAFGGRVAQKLGISDVDTALATGAIRPQQVVGAVADEIPKIGAKTIGNSIIKGAVAEGLLEELPQSVMEQVVLNLANDKPWSTDVDSAIVMGTLSGGLMGGAMGGAGKVLDRFDQQREYAAQDRYHKEVAIRSKAIHDFEVAKAKSPNTPLTNATLLLEQPKGEQPKGEQPKGEQQSAVESQGLLENANRDQLALPNLPRPYSEPTGFSDVTSEAIRDDSTKNLDPTQTVVDSAVLAAQNAAKNVMAQEPVAQEPVAQEATAQEATAQEATAQEPVAQEATAQEPVAQEATAQEPVAQEPVAQEATAQEATAQEPVAQEPVAQEPVAQEPVVQEPVAQEATAQELVAQEATAQEVTAQEPVAQEVTAQEPVAQEATAQEPVAQEATAQEHVAQEPVAQGATAQEPVAQEAAPKEVLKTLSGAEVQPKPKQPESKSVVDKKAHRDAVHKWAVAAAYAEATKRNDSEAKMKYGALSVGQVSQSDAAQAQAYAFGEVDDTSIDESTKAGSKPTKFEAAIRYKTRSNKLTPQYPTDGFKSDVAHKNWVRSLGELELVDSQDDTEKAIYARLKSGETSSGLMYEVENRVFGVGVHEPVTFTDKFESGSRYTIGDYVTSPFKSTSKWVLDEAKSVAARNGQNDLANEFDAALRNNAAGGSQVKLARDYLKSQAKGEQFEMPKKVTKKVSAPKVKKEERPTLNLKPEVGEQPTTSKYVKAKLPFPSDSNEQNAWWLQFASDAAWNDGNREATKFFQSDNVTEERVNLAKRYLSEGDTKAVASAIKSATVKTKAAEAKAAEAKAAEPKAAEPKAAEPKAAEPKAAEPKAAEPKAAEPKAKKREVTLSSPDYLKAVHKAELHNIHIGEWQKIFNKDLYPNIDVDMKRMIERHVSSMDVVLDYKIENGVVAIVSVGDKANQVEYVMHTFLRDKNGRLQRQKISPIPFTNGTLPKLTYPESFDSKLIGTIESLFNATVKPRYKMATPVDRVNRTDSVTDEVFNFVDGLTKMLGMEGKYLITTTFDLQNPNATEKYNLNGHWSAANIMSDQGAGNVASTIAVGSEGFIINLNIDINDKVQLPKVVEAVAHEIGHNVQKQHFDNAPSEVKAKIEEAYQKWRNETLSPNMSLNDFVDNLRNRYGAADDKSPVGEQVTLDEYSKSHRATYEYATSFAEWFADQVSRWTTTQEAPLTLVEKFFAEIAKKMRTIMSHIGMKRYDSVDAINEFLSKIVAINQDNSKVPHIKATKDVKPAKVAKVKSSKNGANLTKEQHKEIHQRVMQQIRDAIDAAPKDDVFGSPIIVNGKLSVMGKTYPVAFQYIPSAKTEMDIDAIEADMLRQFNFVAKEDFQKLRHKNKWDMATQFKAEMKFDAYAPTIEGKIKLSNSVPRTIEIHVPETNTSYRVGNSKLALSELLKRVSKLTNFAYVPEKTSTPNRKATKRTLKDVANTADIIRGINTVLEDKDDPYAEANAYQLAQANGLEVVFWQNNNGDVFAHAVLDTTTVLGNEVFVAQNLSTGNVQVVTKTGILLVTIKKTSSVAGAIKATEEALKTRIKSESERSRYAKGLQNESQSANDATVLQQKYEQKLNKKVGEQLFGQDDVDFNALHSILSDFDTSTPTMTAKTLRNVLSNHFGKDTIEALERQGKLKLVDYDENMHESIEGYYKGGQITLIASRISSEDAVPVLLHELGGHGGFQGLMSDKQYQTLMAQFDRMLKAKHPAAIEANQLAMREENVDVQRLEQLPYLLTVLARHRESKNVMQRNLMLRFVDSIIANVSAYVFDQLGVRIPLTDSAIVKLAERMIDKAAQDHVKLQSIHTQQLNSMSSVKSIYANTSEYVWSTQIGTAFAEFLGKNKDKGGRLPFWFKSLGTMHHLAKTEPMFEPIFKLGQQFVDDISYYAASAAELAPKLLPQIDSIKDFGKKAITKESTLKVQAAVFAGTLQYGRDSDGTLVDTNKPPMGKEDVPVGAVFTDLELTREFGLTTDEIALYREFRSAVNMSLDNLAKSEMIRVTGDIGRMLQDAVMDAMNLEQAYNILVEEINKHEAEFIAAFESDLTHDIQSGVRAAEIALQQTQDDAKDDPNNPSKKSNVTRAKKKLERAIAKDKTLKELQKLTTQPDANVDPSLKKKIDKLRDSLGFNIESPFKERRISLGEQFGRVNKLKKDGYAPLQRFGEYTLTVKRHSTEVQEGEENGEQEVELFMMFESAYERNKTLKSVRAMYEGKENFTVEVGTMDNKVFKMFQGLSLDTIEQFGEQVGMNDGQIENELFQEYLSYAKSNRSAMKRLMNRKGIKGFETDLTRVLASFVYSNARRTSSNLNLSPMNDAILDIPKLHGDLRNVAMDFREYLVEPQENDRIIRPLMFAQYLGGSVASAAINLTQPFMVTAPWLSQFGGFKQAGVQVARATKELAWKANTKFDPQLTKAIKRAEDDGVIAPQEIFQLLDQAQGGQSLKPMGDTFSDNVRAKFHNKSVQFGVLWGAMFSIAEQYNRKVTFVAAYRIAVAQNMPDPDKFAREAVVETQFMYTKAAKMQWGRNAIGGLLLVFKTYLVSYLELMWRLWNKDGTKEEKRAAKLAMLGMLGMLMLAGGADGLPFMEDIEDIIDTILQLMGYNISVGDERREFVIDALTTVFGESFGGAVGRTFNGGFSRSPLVGVDVSGRLGMGNIIPMTGIFKVNDNKTHDVAELGGAGMDFVSRVFNSVNHTFRGDFDKAAIEVMPMAVQNAIKGGTSLFTGEYRDGKGNLVDEVTVFGAAMKTIGFQPQNVAQVSEANFSLQKKKAFYNTTANQIREQWARGIYENDREKVEEARERMMDWNKKNPDFPMIIRIPDIMKRVRNMRKNKTDLIIDSSPRHMRDEMRQKMRKTLDDNDD